MLYIHHVVSLNNSSLSLDGTVVQQLQEAGLSETATTLYRSLGLSYPKFFKMDLLSKAAFLAAEVLMQAVGEVKDKDNVATLLSTASGCMDVDEKFEATRSEIASPALFVYTLPNIMLGELCIRHQFKGEQMCTLTNTMDIPFTEFYIRDLMEQRQASACLCGFAEAYEDRMDVRLIWVSKAPGGQPFNTPSLQQIFAWRWIP